MRKSISMGALSLVMAFCRGISTNASRRSTRRMSSAIGTQTVRPGPRKPMNFPSRNPTARSYCRTILNGMSIVRAPFLWVRFAHLEHESFQPHDRDWIAHTNGSRVVRGGGPQLTSDLHRAFWSEVRRSKAGLPYQKRARFGVLEPPRFDDRAAHHDGDQSKEAGQDADEPETHLPDRLARQPGDVDREEEQCADDERQNCTDAKQARAGVQLRDDEN